MSVIAGRDRQPRPSSSRGIPVSTGKTVLGPDGFPSATKKTGLARSLEGK